MIATRLAYRCSWARLFQRNTLTDYQGHGCSIRRSEYSSGSRHADIRVRTAIVLIARFRDVPHRPLWSSALKAKLASLGFGQFWRSISIVRGFTPHDMTPPSSVSSPAVFAAAIGKVRWEWLRPLSECSNSDPVTRARVVVRYYAG